MEFTIRPWEISDLDSLVKYANNINIAKYMTNKFPHPYTSVDGKAFIEFANSDDPVHIFAIDVDGEAVGGIGIHPQSDIYEKNAEIGYWLGQPFWGNGIVGNAINKMLDFAFTTYDIDRVYAMTFQKNTGSQKALLKNNFVFEAHLKKTVFKNNEYLDEHIYGIRREDRK